MVKTSVLVGWGLGSLGLAVILNTFNVLLIAYLTVVVGIEPAFAGSLVLIAKLYDVVTDLPMGWLSDRTRTRWGSRRPYLFLAGFITPLALVLLFTPPVGDRVVYVTAALLLYATGYTLFNVPYLSMPAEMTSDTHIRTRMVAWRSLFIAGGTLFGVSIAPYLIGSLHGGPAAYAVLGKIMALVVAAAFLGSALLTRMPNEAANTQTPISLGEQLSALRGNRHFLTLLGIKVTHLLAMSIGAGSLFFLFRYVLQTDLQTLGLYGAVTTLVWAVLMPAWTYIARRYGKRRGYFLATALYALITLSWLFASNAEPLLVTLLRGGAFGVISGGMLLMGNAMLQDVMDDDFRRTGTRKNGLYAGSYSLVEKVTSGIGAQILGGILSWSGFNRLLELQSESALQGIYIVTAIIPAVLMLLSLIVIHAYRLDESQLKPL